MNSGQSKKAIPFVVLFEGKSGSTFLIEALDSHPQIQAEKEYLATLGKRIKRGKEDPDAQLRWARDFLMSESNAECSARGFKTKLKDVIDPKGFASVLNEVGARIILLHRRNRIKLLVSLLNSIQLNERTGDWNLYDDGDRLPPLTVDLEKFDQWLGSLERRHDRLISFVERLTLPTLSIHYEDILLNNAAMFKAVCEFF